MDSFVDSLCRFVIFFGYPCLYSSSFAVDDLDRRSLYFFSVRDVYLADLDLRPGIFYKDDPIFRRCYGAAYLSALIDRERCIRRDRIPFRCYGLTQRIGLTDLQAFDLMDPFVDFHCRFVIFFGYPCLYSSSLTVDDLDRCTLYFFSVRDVYLADLDIRILICKVQLLKDFRIVTLNIYIEGTIPLIADINDNRIFLIRINDSRHCSFRSFCFLN